MSVMDPPSAGCYSIYYCWDKDGRLLYVGCTGQKLKYRIGQHRHSSHWFEYVANVTSQTVTTPDECFSRLYTTEAHKLWMTASLLEKTEIERLAPVFNLYAQPDRGAALRYLHSVGYYDQERAAS